MNAGGEVAGMNLSTAWGTWSLRGGCSTEAATGDSLFSQSGRSIRQGVPSSFTLENRIEEGLGLFRCPLARTGETCGFFQHQLQPTTKEPEKSYHPRGGGPTITTHFFPRGTAHLSPRKEERRIYQSTRRAHVIKNSTSRKGRREEQNSTRVHQEQLSSKKARINARQKARNPERTD